MGSIQLKNIMKRYAGDVIAVHDFSLDIKDKEFVVLVGPSGCGKSTTLRMIAGLEEISAGELYIGDKLVNNVPPKDRDIAMVFQNYALYPHMTVYKNMSFGLELRKMPKEEIRKRVTEAAQILDIEHLLNRKPRALSGGQRQRVALGRAMVRDPAVFLLDEPLSNLDAKLRAQMRTEISKLHKRLGTTFVYVTHDQVEAMTMGDRIIVMKDGFIQQVDTPQNLYDRPCNMFVAGFIGSPQMNFLPAVLTPTPEGHTLGVCGHSIPLPKGKLPQKLAEVYTGKTLQVGIRPEDFHEEPVMLEALPGAVIEAYVDIAELMGSEVYLHMHCGTEKLTARVPARTNAKTGDTIRLAIDTNKLHLFDASSEKSLLI